jgi:hypothetical protein
MLRKLVYFVIYVNYSTQLSELLSVFYSLLTLNSHHVINQCFLIQLGQFRQACENGHSHLYQNAW